MSMGIDGFISDDKSKREAPSSESGEVGCYCAIVLTLDEVWGGHQLTGGMLVIADANKIPLPQVRFLVYGIQVKIGATR
jgi:hypothetical protein